MTQHVHFEQAPPRSWDQFEELCADAFQEEWQDSTLVRHGRTGQTQHGVDIVGRDGANWPVGIQCKRKSLWPVSEVTTRDLDDEVEKAKNFKPALRAFYLVSTAPDDQPLQQHARLITERHQREGLFAVAVIGWGELVRRATRHQHVAAKHFGPYSSGAASPLLTTWRASAGKLLLEDRELRIAIRELIHDLQDYPSGRIVFRQTESEDLLFQIKQLQATGGQSLDDREAVLELRDKLAVLRKRESAVIEGLMLLFGHKDLKDYVRSVWEQHAPLLVRSFVEQSINPDLWDVTGLEKITLHPPVYGEMDPLPVFMPPADIEAIFAHQRKLGERWPGDAANNVRDLPDDIQFRHALPAVIRKILAKIREGVPLGEMERNKWLDPGLAWKFRI
jgi:hypothetical protein